MKTLLISLLVLTTLQQDSILSVSGDDSSQVAQSIQGDSGTQSRSNIIGSASSFISNSALLSASAQPTSWSFLSSRSIGENSQWKTPIKGDYRVYPQWWITTYLIKFSTDCLGSVSLSIAATSYFQVYLNGTLIKDWQSPWPSISKFQFTPFCGCNQLKVVVWNYWWSSPAAIIYFLTQNQSDCYNCPNQGVTFYNRDTCKCECSSTGCSNKALRWSGYPNCNCQCPPPKIFCPLNKYMNIQTCSCQCKKVCCPTGYKQNPNSCACQNSCPGTCPGQATMNQQTCQCQCNVYPDPNCGIAYYFDRRSGICSCVSFPIGYGTSLSSTLENGPQ